jgi:hypothetical protein
MAELKKRRSRGLAAVAQAREDRAGGRSRWTAQAGLAAGVAVLGGLIAHKVVTERDLRADRQTLLSKQRAVAATLGAEWYPVRDRLEADVATSAAEYKGDVVEAEAKTGAFRSAPGLYLRLRVAEAGSAANVRKVAADARKDGFVGCLMREPNERGVRGEVDGGAFAEQPWNLGQAYAATRILTDDWVNGVKEADDDLRMRVFKEQYTKAVDHEIPFAIEIVKRAQFFVLVLDEDVPEAVRPPDGGSPTEEGLQLVLHPARVHVFDLATNKTILRLRRSAEARVIPAGERAVTDSETQDAMQRQANNCALAHRVETALALPSPALLPQ